MRPMIMCCLSFILLGLNAHTARAADAKDADAARAKLRAMLENARLPEVKFEGTALDVVVDFVRDVSLLPITAEWNEIEKARIDRAAPVNAKLKNITLGALLDEIARSAAGDKLAFYADDGTTIRLTTRARAEAACKANGNSYLLPLPKPAN